MEFAEEGILLRVGQIRFIEALGVEEAFLLRVPDYNNKAFYYLVGEEGSNHVF